MERLALPLASRESSLNPVPHVFNAEELARCSTGDCKQCGRCCIVYRVFVPKNNDGTGLYEKVPGEVCPHLNYDERGLAVCEVHAYKDKPILESCRDYNGTNGNYEDIVAMSGVLRSTASTPREIALVTEWTARGLFSDVP